MTPPDPARIAAGLTGEMRDVLMRFPANGGEMLDVPPKRLRPSAKLLGGYQPMLIAFGGSRGRWRLTPLGRAVRAALAEGSSDPTPTDGATP